MKAVFNQVPVVVENRKKISSHFSTFTDGSDNDRNQNKLPAWQTK